MIKPLKRLFMFSLCPSGQMSVNMRALHNTAPKTWSSSLRGGWILVLFNLFNSSVYFTVWFKITIHLWRSCTVPLRQNSRVTSRKLLRSPHHRAGVFSLLFLHEVRDLARYESLQSNTPIESLLFQHFHGCDRQQISNASNVAYQFLGEEGFIPLGVPSF